VVRLTRSARATGEPVSGGTLAGGTLAGGAVAGGAVPGGTVAGGAVPGGTVAGGAVAGGAVAGGAAPAGAVPGGAVAGRAVPGRAVPGGAVPGPGGPLLGRRVWSRGAYPSVTPRRTFWVQQALFVALRCTVSPRSRQEGSGAPGKGKERGNRPPRQVLPPAPGRPPFGASQPAPQVLPPAPGRPPFGASQPAPQVPTTQCLASPSAQPPAAFKSPPHPPIFVKLHVEPVPGPLWARLGRTTASPGNLGPVVALWQ
jgi:hypothetical protein